MSVKDNYSLFISNTTGYYSTKLGKVDNITFKVQYYNIIILIKGIILKMFLSGIKKNYEKLLSNIVNNKPVLNRRAGLLSKFFMMKGVMKALQIQL